MESKAETESLIQAYIDSQPEPKRSDLEALHRQFLGLLSGCRLWFLDGKDGTGKVVSNPNIGYGERTQHYADGSTKEFYRLGLSANTSGISVYVLGIQDKALLAKIFGDRLGKANITGYCIKFKRLQEINVDVLLAGIQKGLEAQEV